MQGVALPDARGKTVGSTGGLPLPSPVPQCIRKVSTMMPWHSQRHVPEGREELWLGGWNSH